MCRLSKWYLGYEMMGGVKRRVARGVVSGHYRLDDGKQIHTSQIKFIEMEGDTALIRTRNTLYKCDMKDALYDEFKYTDLIEGFEEYRAKYSDLPEPVSEVDDNQAVIRLGNNREYYYDSVHIKYKGQEEIITEPDVHVGMIQDSVLSRFCFGDTYIFFDYFPYKNGCLEFYSWDDSELEVYIENCGDRELYVTVGGNVYNILPQERKLISEENMMEASPLLSTEDLHNVWDEPFQTTLLGALNLMTGLERVIYDEAGNCYLDLSDMDLFIDITPFFRKYAVETEPFQYFMDKKTVDRVNAVKIVVDDISVLRHEFIARRPYYRLRGKPVDKETMEYLSENGYSSQFMTIHEGGTVGKTGWMYKFPALMEVVAEFVELQMIYPFMDYCMAVSMWNECNPKDVHADYKYEEKEYDKEFYDSLELGIRVQGNKIEVMNAFTAAEMYKRYADIYEKGPREKYFSLK